jgi:cellulose synthase (UDP-forming)
VNDHLHFVGVFWKHHRRFPRIDIFLPVCGEDNNVLKKTFAAVRNVRYPNKKVYVLDDKGIKKHKKISRSFGFTYLSRKDKGHMKKAGNIKYGYEHSEGTFVVIFDADFAPHPDFIRELLPYMDDPRVGIIQSPQYFQSDDVIHRRSRLEYGASNVQEDFYRFIQVARNNLGAPVCCGSNAIYRRSALDAIGGTTQIEHSEDMYTGFNLINNGGKVAYIPVILAVGICPQNIQAYFHQQHRWCSGSIALMLDGRFWKSNLRFSQKICFLSGFMYYLSHPLTFLFSFNCFVVLFWFSNDITLANSLLFIPSILFSWEILPRFRISKPRFGNFIARTADAFSYTHAVFSGLIKTKVGWHPTNAVKAKVSRPFMQLFAFTALYFVTYTALMVIAVQRGFVRVFDMNYYLVLFWIFYNIFSISFILYALSVVIYTVTFRETAIYKTIRSRLSNFLISPDIVNVEI